MIFFWLNDIQYCTIKRACPCIDEVKRDMGGQFVLNTVYSMLVESVTVFTDKIHD